MCTCILSPLHHRGAYRLEHRQIALALQAVVVGVRTRTTARCIGHKPDVVQRRLLCDTDRRRTCLARRASQREGDPADELPCSHLHNRNRYVSGLDRRAF